MNFLKLATIVLTTATLSTAAYSADKPRVEEFSSSAGGSLKVENPSGPIHIKGYDTKVIKVTALRQKGSCDIEIKREGSAVIVDVEKSKRGLLNDCQYSIAIEVPRKLKEVDVAVGSGSILVDGVQADVDLAVGSGDVVLKNITGDVDASVGSGSLGGEIIAKDVDLKVGSGDIDIRGDIKKFDAKTGSGDIKVSLSSMVEDFDIKLGSGDGFFDLKKGVEDFDMRLGSGDVELKLGQLTKSGRGEVKLASGDVVVTVPKGVQINVLGKKRYELKGADEKTFEFKVKSFSGDVRVVNE